MFVNTFIKRPILASVCSLVIILGGVIAIPTMPVAQFPPLAPPNISVTAIYTGANAQEVETAVTTPLEQAINGAEGMLYMSSSSSSSGVSTITVTFDVTRDQDLAQVDVQNRVSTALGRLPTEVRQLGVTVSKQTTGFVMAAGVYAEKGEYDSLFLSNYIDVYVKDALKRVPRRQRRHHLRRAQVLDAAVARSAAAGGAADHRRRRDQRAAAAERAGRRRRARPGAGAAGTAVSAVGARRRPPHRVRAVRRHDRQGRRPTGPLVRLKDVGHAELGAETYSSQLRFQGVDAVGFGVIQLPSANALDVAQGVRDELLRLSTTFPPGMKVQVALDTTEVVHDSIREVLKTLVEAIALVVLVIFIFLQSWRSTLIPVITIPVSLVGAFGLIKLLDYSINTLTLFGVILATGIVVDDAIVVIENIERHIQEYKVRRQAGGGRRDGRSARRGRRHGAGADRGVRADRVLPRDDRTHLRAVRDDHRVRGGAVGVQRDHADAGVVGAAARPGAPRQEPLLRAISSAASPPGTNGYVRFITAAMKSRWALVVVFFVFLGLTYWTYGRVPQSFVPDEDQGYFITQVQAPAGASLQYTADIAQQAEQLFLKDPDVLAVFSVMGFSFSGAAPNQGIVFVRLKPFDATAGRRALGAGGHRPADAAAVGDPRRDHRRLLAAVDPRPEPLRRLRVPGARSERHRTSARWRAAPTRSWGRRRSRRWSGTSSRRSRPTIRSSWSRSIASARSPQGCRSARSRPRCRRSSARRYVNDFQFNNRAYRVYVQADAQFRSAPRDLKADLRALAQRPDGAARERRHGQGGDGAAGHRPLQPVPLGDAERLAGARRQLGRCR